MPFYSSTKPKQFHLASKLLSIKPLDITSTSNDELKSLSKNENILTYYSTQSVSKFSPVLSFDDVIKKLLRHNLVNPSRNNAWEFPHNGGVIAHECGVQVLANILSDKVLNLFSNAQQKNILSDLNIINNLQKIYIMYHDIGKMHPVFNKAVNDKHEVKANNKEIEKACTLMCIFMTQIEGNQELLGEFNNFINKYQEIALENNKNPELQESLFQDLSNFESCLNLAVEQSNVRQYQKSLFYILTKSMYPDHIGKTVARFNRIQDKQLIDTCKNNLADDYKNYQEYCQDINMKTMHKDSFMFLKASNYIADIAYYMNLRSMYFDKNFDLHANFELLLKNLFNPEYENITISDKISYSLYVNTHQEIKIPAFRPVWSIGGKLHNLSMQSSLGMMQVLSKAGFYTLNQEEEIYAFSTEFTQDNYTALQGENSLLQVITAQNNFLLDRVKTLKGDKNFDAVLPNLRDFASSNIFSIA